MRKLVGVFRGGPMDGERTDLPPWKVDRYAVDGPLWFRRPERGGDVMIVRGPRDRYWVAYSQHVYERRGEPEGGVLELHYVGDEEVLRCTHYLPKVGRQCGNRALPGGDLCNVHRKK